MEIIGLIAGLGTLPELCAQEIKKRGFRLATFDLAPFQENVKRGSLKKISDWYWEISLANFSQIFSLARKKEIKKIVNVGSVRKESLFQCQELDSQLLAILANIPHNSNETLLLALAEEFQRQGIEILSQLEFLSSYQAPSGVLTKNAPTKGQWQDLHFAYGLAKEVAKLGIGQTVVVRAGTVLAVEAMEGTDATIRRGGELAREAVVVKVSSPNQDLRFDLPVIGPSTIEAALAAKASVLAFDAELTVLLAQKELVALAEDGQLSLVALGEEKR